MPTRNAQNDRSQKFIPNRILKADELIRLQDMDQARDVRGLGTLFNQGATLNVQATVNGSTVNLGAADQAYPMWVFVNGAFEQLTPVSFNLDPSKSAGDDFIYANWVLWRVTADGESGSIPDGSLVDVSTGEKVAEVGQLELTISTSDASGDPVDSDKQLSKNASPIVMFRLQRGDGGSVTPHATERLINAAAATKDLLGFVKLSTATSTIAVADDDPRLHGFELSPRTIRDIHVTMPHTVTPPVFMPWWGIAKADCYSGDGISTNSIFDRSTQTLLSDLIPGMVSILMDVQQKVVAMWSGNHDTGGGDSNPAPPPAPAYTPPPAASVPSDHVGQALGLSGTHPARVDSDAAGFTVKRTSAGPGSPDNAAFGVQDKNGTLLAGITHDGDVKASKASVSTIGNTALGTLAVIAATLANHVNNHPGGGGGGGVSQQYVDNADIAKLAEAKAYTDQKLGGAGGGVTLNIDETGTNISWTIFTINNMQIAFGSGPVQNGQTVILPAGFYGFNGQAAFGRTFTIGNATQLHCFMEEDHVVHVYTVDQDGNRSTGDWAFVTGVCYRWK